MDPAQILQGADPVTSMACADAKRLRRSAMPADTVSKVFDTDNTSSWPAPPLDDNDLLEEILLRLRPKPSSLPRASLVCTRWHTILSDPAFLKRYRKHHKKAPILGFFTADTGTEHNFVPVLTKKPNRIPAERFTIPRSSSSYDHWIFLGCRHGLGVLINCYGHEVIVWDPLTGRQHHVPFPPELRDAGREIYWSCHAAVLCADDDDGHVHGDCFSSPFKLVLIGAGAGQTHAFACLYESVSGVWGNIVSTLTTTTIRGISHNVLIRNALYCMLGGGDILAFDIGRQTLSQIGKPTEAYHTGLDFQLWRRNDDCGLGLAVMSKLGLHLWEWKMNSEGVFRWVLQPKIIQLEGLFPIRSDQKQVYIVGYDEESNVIVLATYIGDFMLQLNSMRFRRISERNSWDTKMHYPYRNFYTAGKGVGWK